MSGSVTRPETSPYLKGWLRSKYLPWFDKATNGVRFEALLATLQTLPARDSAAAPCCHNPTGADLTPEQWDRGGDPESASADPVPRHCLPGFGAGLEEDAYAIRAIASAGMPMLVSNSFSKIFSLYGSASAACRWSVKTVKPQAACWAS